MRATAAGPRPRLDRRLPRRVLGARIGVAVVVALEAFVFGPRGMTANARWMIGAGAVGPAATALATGPARAPGRWLAGYSG